MYEEGCHSGRDLARTGTVFQAVRFVATGLLLLTGLKASAADVTLGWDINPSATVVGYKVYYGVASRVYTNGVNAGATNILTITGLTAGTRYFFAATATDNLGQESPYSSETNYVPGSVGNAPFISSISNQSILVDETTPALAFTIGDAETAASNLTVSGSSGNSALVAPAGIVFGGAGSNRTVTVTPLPGASGTALITVTVGDGTGSSSTSFQLSVINSRPINTAPTISAIPGQFIAEGTVAGPIGFTVGDAESAASSLTVSASSSDQTVAPNGNIVLGSSGSNRMVTVTPGAGVTGSAMITLTVSDGDLSANTSFLLTVETTSYSPMAAAYSGLFYEPNQVQLASAGSFNLSTTAKSTYSGKVKSQGKTYSVSGKLDAFGRGSNSIPRTGLSPLVLVFDCGASNYDGVVFGTLSGSGWQAAVSGDRLLFNAKTRPAPWIGIYTLVFPGQTGSKGPVGHSYGTVKITAAGAVTFAGSLGDGAKVSQAATLSKDGMWPFYAPLYLGKGLLLSWMAVSNSSGIVPDVAGPLSWIKEADPLAKLYPGGFSNQCNVAGSVYVKPAAITQHIIHLNKAKVSFAGGDLPTAFTNSVDIVASSKVINGGTNLMSMSFSLAKGTFSGKVLDPSTHKSKTFGGVVLQKFTSGYGMLMGTNSSSQVELMGTNSSNQVELTP
jgi:hypothetical protein